MLSELAKNIIKIALNQGGEEIQVKIRNTEAYYTRFANSEIHQFSKETLQEIRITALIGKKKGFSIVVPTNEKQILSSIRNLILMTKSNDEDPSNISLIESGKKYKDFNTVDPKFTEWDQTKMAESVKDVIQEAHDYDKRVTNVSGMLQSIHHKDYFLNSNNLELTSDQTEFWYGIDVLASEGESYGRNSQGEVNRFADKIPFQELTESAAKFAILGLNPIKLEPGDYTAILDYYAVLEPLVFINLGLSGLFVVQHRSFLARKLNEKIFAGNFNLKHSPHMSELTTSKSFDDEGVPTQEFYFIKNGILQSFAHNRWSAQQMNTESNGCGYESENTAFGIPIATIFEPSKDITDEDLIHSVDEGIFISRLYYTNWANPMAGILTGTTRNGFFKIESGEITASLTPMRHTTSVFEMFDDELEISNKCHQPPMQMMPGVQSIMTPSIKVPRIHMTTYAN